MRVYTWSGDRAAALQQYRSCVRVLEEQLGVPPLEETTELYKAIVDDQLAPPKIDTPRPNVKKPSAVRPEATFVGRDRELDELFASAARGHETTVAVTVEGEPGIGKTRLVDEFLGSLERDATARAKGHRGEETVPYGLAVDLLRSHFANRRLDGFDEPTLSEISRLLPELRNLVVDHDAGRVESPGGHRRFLEAITHVLTAPDDHGAPVIMIDDLHWADAETLDLIAFLGRHSQRPALIVLSYRSNADDRPPVRFDREVDVSRITLDRLNQAEVARLVEADAPEHLPRLDELISPTEGIPYFLVEFLSTLDASDGPAVVPTGVLDLLEERIESISNLGVQVLSTAAVIGSSFSHQLLGAVSGRSPDETVQGLEELLTRRMIREAPEADTFDFDHEQLRNLAYARTTAPRRTLLHSRLADELLAGSGDAMAAAAAHHRHRAGRDLDAAAQYVLAADRAAALYANASAIEHYEQALALGHPETARIRGALGDLYALEGDYTKALASLEAAAAVSSGEALAHLEHRLGLVHVRAGDIELAEARFAVAEAGLGESRIARTHLLADWAAAVSRSGDDARARELAARSLSHAAATSDPLSLAQAHNTLGIVERFTDPLEARTHHEVSLALVEHMNPAIRAAALNNLALTYLASGDPSGGLPFGQEALELCERIGDRHKQAAVHNNLADLLHEAGRDDEANTHLVHAVKLFTGVGDPAELLQPQIWMLTDW